MVGVDFFSSIVVGEGEVIKTGVETVWAVCFLSVEMSGFKVALETFFFCFFARGNSKKERDAL